MTDKPRDIRANTPLTPDRCADLAKKLARRLFEVGDGSRPCTRLQFIGGDYHTREYPQGGFCESALERWLAEQLQELLP